MYVLTIEICCRIIFSRKNNRTIKASFQETFLINKAKECDHFLKNFLGLYVNVPLEIVQVFKLKMEIFTCFKNQKGIIYARKFNSL